MIFFYGLRSSKLKERKLSNTKCPYCQKENSFTATTFGKYFHFFWIPIIPISKTSVAECSHCKKTYAEKEFSEDMMNSLIRANSTNPAKRPLWHGIGCMLLIIPILIIIGLIVFSLIYHTTNDAPLSTAAPLDNRRTLLDNDIDKLSESRVFESDSTTLFLRNCITGYLNPEIDKSTIKYLTKRNQNKLLILLEIRDIKKIEAKSRKQLITLIEACVEGMSLENTDQFFIGIEGKYNTVLVKTPFDQDLGGRFADKYKLLDFYTTEKTLDTIDNVHVDSISVIKDSIKTVPIP
ncbi:zinc-ribbon domain-containing protein [Aquimarina celericrescens]|uniref:Zinc-ribbon domain-containing protein n=1 Tax=Aquimarina celericrescens TaxID=1964542 RepID=A0ABW5ATZ5_9FLAO|nr:zinc-ribbon domain-containing protein [Aquimarina celericrescens]